MRARYLINGLFALLVLLSLFLDLFPLLNLINQLEKVAEVEDHWFSLGMQTERKTEIITERLRGREM